MDGMFPRAYSHDHPGPLTRSVTDCAIALQILAGYEAGDTSAARKPVPDYSVSLRQPAARFRIGVDRTCVSLGQPTVLERFQKALDQLRSLGSEIADISTPLAESTLENFVPLHAELDVSIDPLYYADPNRPMGPESPYTHSAGDYIRAMQKRRDIQIRCARAVKGIDVLACPSYALEKRSFDGYPKIHGKDFAFADAVHYSYPFDLLGVPVISIPCGFSDEGFPVGLQLVGRAFDEVTVLRAGSPTSKRRTGTPCTPN